jgi:Ni,Fe-hydrogenase III small subunit
VVGCPPNPVAILNGILQTVRSPVFDTAGTEK